MSYDLQSIQLPRLAGAALNVVAAALENPATRGGVLRLLMSQAGILRLRALALSEPPTYVPHHPRPYGADGPPPDLQALLDGHGELAPLPWRRARDFVRAYREGRTTPEEVAERFLEALRRSQAQQPPLSAFIAQDREDLLAQARASTERWRRLQPCGPLDGVPVAVKDEIDQAPYPTTVGTAFLGRAPASADATVVARLRAAGALLVGKANMHEIGINPTGYNGHHGSVRNPYDLERDTGGSSSGSAAVVASGLCPIAIGADGGGSIRIPAALCGVVGLKATFGRVSERGAYPLCWSVAHIGPLGASVEDVALAYAVIAGPDDGDLNTLGQPAVTLTPPPGRLGQNGASDRLDGLRLGVYRPWFEHAEPAVVAANRELLAGLERAGAVVREIEIPELEAMRLAHATTILAEMTAALGSELARTGEGDAFSPTVRLNLWAGQALGASDYVRAQRVRTRALATFAQVFREVDLIVTPATAITAARLPRGLRTGWSDLSTVTEYMRYVVPGNLAGLPAIVVPAGYDPAGLPIGMQLYGRPWDEALLLRVAALAESLVPRRAPALCYDLLAS